MLRSRKETFRKLFLSVPLPFSKWLYAIARIAIIRDGHQPYFDMVFQEVQTKKLKGDYLEFGVFQGNSFILAANLAERHGLKAMRFLAFDLPCLKLRSLMKVNRMAAIGIVGAVHLICRVF
jgi:hypothetical protein